MMILLKDAEPGVVLKDPAVNHQGQVLLPAGTELDAKKLRILRSWGVSDIEVEDTGDGGDGVSDAPMSAQVAEIQNRFRRVREDPIMEKILAVLASRAGSEA